MTNNDDLDGLLSSHNDQSSAPATDPAPDFDTLRRMFREAASATEHQRRHATEDRAYFDGPGQLDEATREKMRRNRAPETYSNKITSAVGATLGLFDASETSPEAVARNEDDEAAATIVTQVLRYQADKTRLTTVLQDASQDYLVEGICAAKIEIDQNDDCRVTHIPYRNFYYDPRSMKHDFSDATYLIHAYWVDVDQVKRKWPEVADLVYTNFGGDGPEDNPRNAALWVDATRRRVMIVDNFYQDGPTGQWKRAIYCHSTLLEHGDTGYKDDGGRDVCPIEALSYHVMDDGERIGMVRNLVPKQRQINGLEATIHRLAISNRVEVSGNQKDLNLGDRDLARAEAQRTDAAMPPGWTIMSLDARLSVLSENVARLKQEIDDATPSRAQLAQAGANTSGRARQMLQQAGLTELARAQDRMEGWEERVSRQMWFRARQFMTDRQMIRVTDNAGARQSLVINDPIIQQQMQPVMAPKTDPQTGQPAMGPDGQPAMAPVQHPVTGQFLHQAVPVHVGTKNQLAMMDMDITLKVVQTADTLRGEAKQQLLDFAAKTGISLLDPNFKFAIKFSDIPDKEAILADYEECLAEAQAQAAPQQQAQQQAAQAQQQVTATAVEAKAKKDQAQAERDATVAAKHQAEITSIGLDNEWKAALLRSGHNPNDASI